MDVLCWMAVTLGLLLSAGNSLAAVDQNQLAGIVKEILNRFKPSYQGEKAIREPMFSLAVSIPYNSAEKKYDVSQVTDTRDEVMKKIVKDCGVYTSRKVVAATVLRWPNVLDQCPEAYVQWPDVLTNCGQTMMTWADVLQQCPEAAEDGRADHAEYRVVQHFDTLVSHLDKSDLLLFYVLASPCDQMCTSESSPWSILEGIKKIKKWDNYAVVFSNVFKPRDSEAIAEQDLRGALERLGQSVGLSHIFRCKGRVMQCTSCSIDNQLAPYCYSGNANPGPSHNLPSASQSGLGVRNTAGGQVGAEAKSEERVGAKQGTKGRGRRNEQQNG